MRPPATTTSTRCARVTLLPESHRGNHCCAILFAFEQPHRKQGCPLDDSLVREPGNWACPSVTKRYCANNPGFQLGFSSRWRLPHAPFSPYQSFVFITDLVVTRL